MQPLLTPCTKPDPPDGPALDQTPPRQSSLECEQRTEQARAPRGHDPGGRELLDRVGEDRRRRPVEPVRPDERLDETTALLGVLGAVLQDPAELLRVLVERRGDVQEAAVLLAQVVKVQRAL